MIQLDTIMKISSLKKAIFGDLANIAQDLMHYFDTRGGTTLITTLLLDHQEAIQLRAAENVIDQDHRLGSNHGPPDSQADIFN